MPHKIDSTPAILHNNLSPGVPGRRIAPDRSGPRQWPAWMRDFGAAWAGAGSHWVTKSGGGSEPERRSTR